LNKEGISILKTGNFDGIMQVFKIEDNEQVIGIKAKTKRDTADKKNYGRLYNLQFQIVKLI
jgi:hypothetical protein